MHLRTIVGLMSNLAVVVALSGCGSSQKAVSVSPTPIPSITPQLRTASVDATSQKPTEAVPIPTVRPLPDAEVLLGSGPVTLAGSWFVVGYLPPDYDYSWPAQLNKVHLYYAEKISVGVDNGGYGDALDNQLRGLLELNGKPILKISSDLTLSMTIASFSFTGTASVNNAAVDFALFFEGRGNTCKVPTLGVRLLVFRCIGSGVFILGREPIIDTMRLEAYLAAGSRDIGGISWTLVGTDTSPKKAYSLRDITQTERSSLVAKFQEGRAATRRQLRRSVWLDEFSNSLVLFDDGSAKLPDIMANSNYRIGTEGVSWELAGSKLRLTSRTVSRSRPEFDGKTWAIQCDYSTVGKELTLLCDTVSDPQDNSWFRGALFLFSAR